MNTTDQTTKDRAVALICRWRVKAAHLENAMDGQYPLDNAMSAEAKTFRECASKLEAALEIITTP